MEQRNANRFYEDEYMITELEFFWVNYTLKTVSKGSVTALVFIQNREN